QRFSFYYVVKIIVRGPAEAYAVLSIDPNISWFDPVSSESRGDQLVGIVPLDYLALVPSRTGLVPNNAREASACRSEHAAPIRFFRNYHQGQAHIRQLAQDVKGEVVEPAWEERFSAEPLPVPDASYGFLVLGTHLIRNAAGQEKTLYHLAVPAK